MKKRTLLFTAVPVIIFAGMVYAAGVIYPVEMRRWMYNAEQIWTYNHKKQKSLRLIADGNLNKKARKAFLRLNEVWQKRGNAELIVVSGYRSPAYNKRVGGARRSQHVKGTAFDLYVYFLGRKERREIIKLGQKFGFRGFGVGATRLHMDMGRRRAWGYVRASGGGTVPRWARDLF